MRRKVTTKTALYVLAAVVAVVTVWYWGVPWGWWPSYGGSYGETTQGLSWVRGRKPVLGQVKVGDNVTYWWHGEGVVKRVQQLSADGGWLWVGGDNTADGASTGSSEVGWLRLQGAATPCPPWPQPNPQTAPQEPIVVRGLVDALWAPFDRRSSFEKKARFFNRPQDVIVAGRWLILKGKESSNAYDRQSGKLVREIPGYVTLSDGQTASFLKPTGYAGDPQLGQIDLTTGELQLAALPQIAAPKPGQVDLRQASITTSSQFKNPVNAFDGDSKTFWGVGGGSAPADSITLRFSKPVRVRSIGIDGTFAFGTALVLVVLNRQGERTVQSDQALNEVIEGFTITLHQKVRQPVTGAIREVSVNE